MSVVNLWQPTMTQPTYGSTYDHHYFTTNDSAPLGFPADTPSGRGNAAKAAMAAMARQNWTPSGWVHQLTGTRWLTWLILVRPRFRCKTARVGESVEVSNRSGGR